MEIDQAGASSRRGISRHWRHRRLVGVLAVVPLLALAACSSSSKSGANASGGATPSTPAGSGGVATSQPSSTSGGGGESGTLTVWHYFSDKNQVKVMTDYADLFEKNHPGVKVDNVFVPYDQMNSKLISAAGAQQGPDVAVFNGADASTLALGGALAPIDSEWSSFADASQFPNSVIHKLDGKVYAVQGYVNLLGLWYNADILQKIGVQPPKTIDDLEAAMAAAKKAGYMGITLCGLPQSQGEWQAYPWLTSSGFSYDKPDAKALESGLSLVRDWVQKGYLSKAATTWDQTVPFQEFAAGKSAFAENGNWQMGTAASTAKFKYGVVPLPLSSSGKVYLGGEGEAVGAFSKHKDLAWQYLKETYFSAQGQLIALKDVGSIPSRNDAAQDPAVTNDELLKPFAETIAKMGANYPAEVVPPKSVADVELTLGQAWSSVLAGQTSPESTASKAVSTLQGLLQK